MLFDDNPLLTEDARESLLTGRGGDGLAHPTRVDDGTWRARRDIVLGLGIPGHPGR